MDVAQPARGLRNALGSALARHSLTRWAVDPTLRLVYLTALAFGFTAIAHENNLGATSSLIAGDSASQYGWVIGLTLLGIGIGYRMSSLAPTERVVNWFVNAEILLTLVSGFSVVLSFWAYANMPGIYITVIRGVMLFISVLVGLEDAFLLRIAEGREGDLRESVSWTYWFANLGGGVAGFTFGQLLVPVFGIFDLALWLGLVDALFVLLAIVYFHKRGEVQRPLLKLGVLVAVTLGIVATLSQGSTVSSMLTQNLYEDRIVRSWNSEYGQKVLTCNERGGCKLFINGQLQFSSQDEHIYHELLVHPALSLVSDNTPRPLRVLVAGGGDGLAVREVLKYPTVEHVTVVDIDPDMTGRVGREEPVATYNAGALFDPRVRAVNQDAFTWVRDTREMFDLILVDLVDPDNEVTSKLYSLEFYKMCNRILSDGGALATQSTSPWYSAKAFWTINLTLERAFGTVVPYHYNVPSFGDWGWNLASKRRFEAEQISIDEDRTRWLADRGWRGALFFGEEDQALRDDMRKKGIVSTLVRPAVFYYYREQDAWSDWGDQP